MVNAFDVVVKYAETHSRNRIAAYMVAIDRCKSARRAASTLNLKARQPEQAVRPTLPKQNKQLNATR
jgi:hypothetical protein